MQIEVKATKVNDVLLWEIDRSTVRLSVCKFVCQSVSRSARQPVSISIYLVIDDALCSEKNRFSRNRRSPTPLTFRSLIRRGRRGNTGVRIALGHWLARAIVCTLVLRRLYCKVDRGICYLQEKAKQRQLVFFSSSVKSHSVRPD